MPGGETAEKVAPKVKQLLRELEGAFEEGSEGAAEFAGAKILAEERMYAEAASTLTRLKTMRAKLGKEAAMAAAKTAQAAEKAASMEAAGAAEAGGEAAGAAEGESRRPGGHTASHQCR
jgi:hypothetical protein